ncbi:hypothetical protein TNCV_2173031 [Trichonephila clavipes]|nr:hypothetical protein TNCV_3406071 [Trichonephila clavipes]GFX32383.1 hypothetical protein TNCV_2173031 [Trichonephila clavipes]
MELHSRRPTLCVIVNHAYNGPQNIEITPWSLELTAVFYGVYLPNWKDNLPARQPPMSKASNYDGVVREA